jgi:hypothetical protein
MEEELVYVGIEIDAIGTREMRHAKARAVGASFTLPTLVRQRTLSQPATKYSSFTQNNRGKDKQRRLLPDHTYSEKKLPSILLLLAQLCPGASISKTYPFGC